MNDTVFLRYSVAVVTPFEDSQLQPIDTAALEQTIQHVCSGLAQAREAYPGIVGGVIVSGTTGEQHSMTVEEKINLYGVSVQYASRFGVPVAAGVSATTIPSVVALASGAVQAGCQGIMLGLPPYIKCSNEELTDYLEAVKSVVPSDFPILLYNNVMRNGYGPSHDTVLSWVERNLIIGMKYAIPTDFLQNSKDILSKNPNLKLYTGGDAMSAQLLAPSSPDEPKFYGLTSILGNIIPTQMADVIAGLTQGEAGGGRIDQARELHAKFLPLAEATLLNVSLPVGVKAAMREMGVNAGVARRPLGKISEDKLSVIRSVVSVFKEALVEPLAVDL